MRLDKLYKDFDSRCASYNNRINAILSGSAASGSWEFNYQTEVLLSDIWQCWNHFTRSLIFSSCRGSIARDGTVIQERVGNNEWKRLSYESKQGAYNKVTTNNGHANFKIRLEPTWGDLNLVPNIVNALNPNNKNQIIMAYGSFARLKDLQLVRNACAHKNVETITDLSILSSRYNTGKIQNAPSLAWSTVNGTTSDMAIELWLYEMNMIADIATASS